MYEKFNPSDRSDEQLDSTVARLTSEVAALKLEVATLVSAMRETQSRSHVQDHGLPASQVHRVQKPVPPSRPSPAPAAIVVLLATSLLAWQLITGPRPDPMPQVAAIGTAAPTPIAIRQTAPPPTIDTATEPPVTPLVTPTIYKGTLMVAADRPGARVFVNRKDVGLAPVRVRNLKAGAHLVWIERDGFRRWTRVVTVPAERVTRVAADLEPVEPVIE